MTSFGCNEIILPGFNPSFIIQGQVYHRIGSLCPPPEDHPKFCQIYFMDNIASQVNTRCNIINGLVPEVVQNISQELSDNNHYVSILKTAKEVFEQQDNRQSIKVVINEERRPPGGHARRYNSPLSDDIGILMPNDNTHNRDIVLHYRNSTLVRICELHRGYDPLQYPLIFPYGTYGWHINLKLQNGKKLTCKLYYCYMLMVRTPVSTVLQAKRLIQQLLVDSYSKTETEQLQFLRREQKSLRADSYQDLRDALLDRDDDPSNVGRRIVLPATFTGGPRYMHERQQDAMSYVRLYGHPDLFITATTNPNWVEIRDNLLPEQNPADRPDIIARVFRLKVLKLLDMLKCEMIFGKVQAWLYSIEWQKRDLPH